MIKKQLNTISKQRGAIIALLCFLHIAILNSQSIVNLVNNGSFEQINKCSNFFDNIGDSKYWFKCTIPGSSDYFNTCATNTNVLSPINFFGNQTAKTGNAYAGFSTFSSFYTNGREYISSGLKSSLITNKLYCINYFVSLAEISRYATANIGIVFTQDSIRYYNPIWPPFTLTNTPVYENTVTIQDTINWVQISTTYTATGNEKFITLGNFKLDVSTSTLQTKPFHPSPNWNYAYYYIDDISITEINPANAAINDTLISRCVSDSVILGTDSTEFASYSWNSTLAGMAALSCTNCPNPTAKPQITTKYYLTKVQCSSTTLDSVVVVVKTPTTNANAGTNQLICEGDILQIGTQDSSAYTSYNWIPNTGLSCTNCAMPYANPNINTTYNLIRQECNIITTSSVQITIDDCNPTFTVPNVFTPNYDDVNDTWGIKFSNTKYIKNFQMHIYDRWGLLVYSTNPTDTEPVEVSTPNSKWDGHTSAGSECSAGVYFYVISFDKNEERVELKGTVNLFR